MHQIDHFLCCQKKSRSRKKFSAVGVRRSTDGKTGLLKFKLVGRRQAPCCCTTTPASTHTRPQQAPHIRTAVTMKAANVSIRVCSVATTALAAGVALCGKVIYTALSCVCHRGSLEKLRLLRTAELALDTKVTHGVFPRSRPSSDTAAVCVVAAVLFILVSQSQGLKMFVYYNIQQS